MFRALEIELDAPEIGLRSLLISADGGNTYETVAPEMTGEHPVIAIPQAEGNSAIRLLVRTQNLGPRSAIAFTALRLRGEVAAQ